MAHEITQILQEWRAGDKTAVDRLFPLVYDELKKQARSYLFNERRDHTLQPTALVNEAYLRLVGINQMKWEDRAHFFAFSATTMRRILVDHARKLYSEKRGGQLQRLTLGNLPMADEQKAADLLELDEALTRLAEIDERKEKVVEMRFFAGLNQKEIAEVLQVNEKTVQRDWQFAKLWLYRELTRKHTHDI
ncbi:MAG: sigma-70 family RNA polymerase sigma factor [Pyrinomonadaceae bacterium]